MRINRPLLLLLLLFWAGFSLAQGFKVDKLLEKDYILTAYRSNDGAELWKSEVRTKKMEQGGKSFFYIIEEGRGLHQKRDVTWRTDSYFYIEPGRLIPYQVRSVFKDLSGRTVETLIKYYDRQRKRISCDHNGRIKEYAYPEGVVDKENLGISLSHFPFDQKGEVRFKLLTNEPSLYDFTAKYLTVEAISRNGEMVPCHKLELFPQNVPFFLRGRILPRLIFWLDTTPPHFVLRYEGSEGGMRSEKVRIETYLK